jgi:hypothetical protein
MAIFPPSSFSMDCHFDEILSFCFCDVAGKSGIESLAIITSNLKIQLDRLLGKTEEKRLLEMTHTDAQDRLDQNTNGTAAQDRFDIGIVTHGVLVVLSFVSFVGNALFVVYVFWLSR